MSAAPENARPPRRTLEGLKKEAKQWLTELRAGDPGARERLERSVPTAPAEPVLRDIQHALAREHGFSGWSALKAHFAAPRDEDPDRVDRADWFLEQACIDPILTNGPAAQASHHAAAMRILARHPEVARANLHTAVVCGDLARVDEILDADPGAASERGGPVRHRYRRERESRWTPLLHLCYGRVSTAASVENAVAIADALLERGADPNAYFEVGTHPSRYTCLTGLVGGGEEATSPHPRAHELVTLLLERGANPVDIQFLYNTGLSGAAFEWFDKLYATSVRLGREHEWSEPRWSPARGIAPFDWLLRIANDRGEVARAEWLAAHGARSDTLPARRAESDAEAPFTAACLAFDEARARELLGEHPEFSRSPVTLFAAAAANRADVVRLVLQLGVPIDVEDSSKQQALHVAASNDAFEVAELLIARGASLEARETNWNNTPLDHAMYGNRTQMVELLTNHSRDIRRVARTGNVSRLRALLAAEPELARVRDADAEGGTTPLMWLPDDDATAVEAVELLLAHGAEATAVDSSGRTAARRAARRGLDDAAALLRAAERSRP